MSSDPEKDPFSKVFDALWSLAEQSDRIKKLVRPGNRIKYNLEGSLTPEKDEVSQGDLPELVLVIVGMTGLIRSTSSSSQALMRLEWWISSGEVGVTNAVLPVAWAVYAAMTPWPTTVAPALKWRDKSFVKLVNMTEAQFGMSRAELNRGVGGWSAVWGCEVTMVLKTDEVIASGGM